MCVSYSDRPIFHIITKMTLYVDYNLDTTLVSRPHDKRIGAKVSLIITLYSYKGGTDKTLLSVNLATIFADKGKKVCLLDLDPRAPSLSSTFKNCTKYWVNDYLNKACKIGSILTDCTPNYVKLGSCLLVWLTPQRKLFGR